ncbi:MAG: hypothetical protein HWE23_10605 [Rhodobacteraceae bacterium]|nr:hypothetical protein [Paracoccaceae bacterium]
MKTKIILFLMAASVAFSCDKATKDVKPNLEAEFETGPDRPFIINPDQLAGDLISGLSLEQLPFRGETENLLNGKFLKYTPDNDFLEGEDHFDLKVKDASGKERTIEVKVVVSDNACNYGPAFDYVQVKAGESTQRDLLANDFFCGGLPKTDNVLGPTGAVAITLVSMTYDHNNFTDYVNITLDLIDDGVVAMNIDAPSTPGEIKIIYEVGLLIKEEYLKGFPSEHNYLKEGGGLKPMAYEYYMVSEAIIEIKD